MGARLADDAHRLEVHPHLALAPLPLKAYASESALDAWETGCTRFKLTVDAGNLPHPERDDYPLRAVIDPEDPAILERELRDALFTLDGVPLRAERQGGPQPGAWYKGRTLDREELLAEHELCVRLGKPTRGDPASPFEVPLTVTLLEAPYDDFDVIEPFTLKVLVAPPGVLERFSVVMFFGAGLAVLLVLLWYLRDRPGLPRDLSYTLVRDGLSGGLPGGLARLRPLGAGPLLGRLLGRTVERPLVAAEGNATLAWLRPTDEELYRVRPAENVRILDENGSAVPVTRGLATLEARRPYQLDGPHGRHLLRLGYI